jgi:hypothetical protein
MILNIYEIKKKQIAHYFNGELQGASCLFKMGEVIETKTDTVKFSVPLKSDGIKV